MRLSRKVLNVKVLFKILFAVNQWIHKKTNKQKTKKPTTLKRDYINKNNKSPKKKELHQSKPFKTSSTFTIKNKI